jgi:hypothetical protein
VIGEGDEIAKIDIPTAVEVATTGRSEIVRVEYGFIQRIHRAITIEIR